MAQSMACDGCGTEPALIIVQNIQEAEVLALCPNDVTGWAIAWLQVVAPEMLAKAPPKSRGKARETAAAAVANDGTSGASSAEGATDAQG